MSQQNRGGSIHLARKKKRCDSLRQSETTHLRLAAAANHPGPDRSSISRAPNQRQGHTPRSPRAAATAESQAASSACPPVARRRDGFHPATSADKDPGRRWARGSAACCGQFINDDEAVIASVADERDLLPVGRPL